MVKDAQATSDATAREADWARELIRRWFSHESGMLIVEGMSIESLVTRFGTPFYLYSHHVLDATWKSLRATYPSPFEVYYSMKANPHQAFLRFFLERGCGIEVASGGELRRALAAGCPAAQILYAGPGKSDEELSMALDARIGEIHIESIGELKRLERLASSMECSMQVALRVNPAPQGASSSMIMGGRPSPFGIDEEQLPELLELARTLRFAQCSGIHLNTGTQWLDAHALIAQYRHGWDVANEIADRLPGGLKTVDFGGGLGIPYFAGEQLLDLEALHSGLNELLATIRQQRMGSVPRLLIEPGRFMVGECGLYVTRVVDVKLSRGHRFVVLDGGMHHHAAATGNFGQTLRRPFPLAVANRLDGPTHEQATIVGPLCTPLDTFARNVPWPDVAPGDIVVVFQSGAYAKTASPLEFLSHRRPAEVWIESKNPTLLEPRGTWDTL